MVTGNFTELKKFEWARGNPGLWKVRSGVSGFFIEYADGSWTQPWERPYFPDEKAKRLHEEYGRIGRMAILAAELDDDEPEDSDLLDEGRPERARLAAFEPAIRREVLRLFRDFGPPTHLSYTGWRLSVDEEVGIPLDTLLEDFGQIGYALELRQAIKGEELLRLNGAGRYSDSFVLALHQKLNSLFVDRTRDCRLALITDEVGHLHSGRTCRDLLTFAWLKLFDSDGMWLNCRGCPAIFQPNDRRQEFHSSSCRNSFQWRRSKR